MFSGMKCGNCIIIDRDLCLTASTLGRPGSSGIRMANHAGF